MITRSYEQANNPLALIMLSREFLRVHESPCSVQAILLRVLSTFKDSISYDKDALSCGYETTLYNGQ